jgi:hypothetical protein
MSGYYGSAHRLLNWVKAERLEPDGQLTAYNGDCYKHSWFLQGAHRLGRFDLTYPVMSFLETCQAPCGGFPHFRKDELIRSLSTAWTGVSALLMGRMDIAEKVAEWCIRLLEDQPDESRFYYQTTRDGALCTDGEFIDTTKTKQCYWEAALPMQHLCRMHMATGERKYLDYAGRYFDFKLRCAEDNYSFVGSGKSSLAAALYYLLTDDERARDCCIRYCDFLVETQCDEGGWRDADYGEPDIPLIYLDHAAEFGVWLQENAAILASKA